MNTPDGAVQFGPIRLQLPPVPSWAQNTANGWSGAPMVSLDGTVYPKPDATNGGDTWYLHANGGGVAYVFDSWGSYIGQKAQTNGTWGDESNFGPELSFIRLWQLAHPGEKVAVVKVCLGGSNIDQYNPSTGTEYAALVKAIDFLKARLIAQNEVASWDGLVFWHGESGASTVWPALNPTPGQEYKDKANAFFAGVRSITDINLPIATARIGDWMLHSDVIGTLVNGIDTPENRIYATNYRRSQQDALANLNRVSVVNMDGLTRLRQGIYSYHIEGSSVLQAGKRLYDGWLIAQGLTPPPPPPPLDVQIWQGGILSTTLTADVFLNGVLQGKAGDIIKVEIRNK